MGFARHLRRVSMAVMTGLIVSMAWATDGALLEVLRHNKLITDSIDRLIARTGRW